MTESAFEDSVMLDKEFWIVRQELEESLLPLRQQRQVSHEYKAASTQHT